MTTQGATRHMILKHETKLNRRGLMVSKTDCKETPYFYHGGGFVMSRFKSLSQAMKQFNFDNSKDSDGRWTSIIPSI